MNWNDVIKFANNGSPAAPRRVERSEIEWQKILTPEQFQITRLKGTERPFTGEHCSSFENGRYACICCHEELFDSSIKFESSSGWPSFTEPVSNSVIKYVNDRTHGMSRVEVMCNVCDAHLGHVFPDGPEPTGLRFCINSASLRLVVEVQ
ncbi:MAG: peptide-methionine (R)-S-oxide reductase MsrB [Vicingaceae bacterium]